jgi:hypothetical protein
MTGTVCIFPNFALETVKTEELISQSTENPLKETIITLNVEKEILEANVIASNFTDSLLIISKDTKKAVEGVEEKLIKTSEDLGKKVESLSAKMETELELGRKVTKEAIEANNQKIQETCASNHQAVEKLQETIEEIRNCTTENQLQQTNKSNQLLIAQLEITKLKVQMLEAKCGKNQEAMDLKMKALKLQMNEKKDVENQLKTLEEKFAQIVQGKLDELLERLTLA